MYFWHHEQLALELRKGIDEYTKFKYFLFTITLYYVIFELLSDKAQFPRFFDFHSGIVGLTILVVGIYLSFSKNQEGDGKDFITRFVCMSWPISIKSMLIAVGLVVLPIYLLSSAPPAENIFYFSFVFGLLFQLSFFYMMIRSLEKISRKPKSKKKSK